MTLNRMSDPDVERLEDVARQVITEHQMREASRLIEEAPKDEGFCPPLISWPGGPVPERVVVTYDRVIYDNEEADPTE